MNKWITKYKVDRKRTKLFKKAMSKQFEKPKSFKESFQALMDTPIITIRIK